MANFVLIAGARLGAWAWAEVVPHLRAAGHAAHPVTLSGLAEKRGLPAGQQTHVQDIVDEIERNDLRDVVLVGHSYAGIPVGQAAERIGDRLAHVVFVDASLPADGESFASDSSDGGAALAATIAANDGFWPPASPNHFGGHGLTEHQIARIVSGSTPHPGATLTEPAALTRPLNEMPATYIHCSLPDGVLPAEWADVLAGYHWQLVELDTGHWPMFSRPRELAQTLLETATK
ncbi:alpha/beta fold hydrolase [Paractinoplanes lichenicola]|uniref:Alpha/beta hydrolase n=1 Tax=Paractinoplanes lichenicola TaxID=2802976 RepID=A0ABS1VGF7_9ACTN|nr:alpha/beta fold hydrolase [Actinoplanes lichenicola]MBL7252852.1 alpha/beta hydrolase [Actinoplanes lichenicola]